MTEALDLLSDEAVRRRCIQLRMALGYEHPFAFAMALRVPPTRWNNVEIGLRLDHKLAQAVARRFPDVSADWLLFGDERNLSVHLRRKVSRTKLKEEDL